MKNRRISWGILIGFVVGLLILIIGGLLQFPEWYYFSFGFPFVLVESIFRLFNWCEGWGCLGPNFLGGIVIYTLIGLIVGLILSRLKPKK